MSMICSEITKNSDEKIIASAPYLDFQISLELKEPWASIPNRSEHFYPFFNEWQQSLFKLKKQFGINFFAPNCLSKENFVRLFLFVKNENYNYIKHEFFVDQFNLLEQLNNILDYLKNISPLNNKFLVPQENIVSEIFVCSHAERDFCCGLYGKKLYESMLKISSQFKNFRIWKSSHIGGHRYAPTFFEAPSMRWYGLFEEKDLENYFNREKNIFIPNRNYRGFSAIENSYYSIVDEILFKKYSWDWLKSSDIIYEFIEKNDNEEIKVSCNYTIEDKKYKNIFLIKFDRFLEKIASCGKEEKKIIKQYNAEIIDSY